LIEAEIDRQALELVARMMKEAHKKVTIMARRRLRYWGDQIVSGIKRDNTLFSYSIPRLRGQRRRGALKSSLWVGGPRKSKNVAGVSVELGWGVPYGSVMELGPARVKRWEIKPTGFRQASSRSGGQTGIRFLRFRGGDRKIHYARKVVRRWKQSELRPHFEPHTEFRAKMMARDMQNRMAEII
jgi:hypothetical protein